MGGCCRWIRLCEDHQSPGTRRPSPSQRSSWTQGGASCPAGDWHTLSRRVEGRLFPPRILSLAVTGDKDFTTFSSCITLTRKLRVILEDMCQETGEKTNSKGWDSGHRTTGGWVQGSRDEQAVAGLPTWGATSPVEPRGRLILELLKDVEDNSSFKENQANESCLVEAGGVGVGWGGERL